MILHNYMLRRVLSFVNTLVSTTLNQTLTQSGFAENYFTKDMLWQKFKKPLKIIGNCVIKKVVN